MIVVGRGAIRYEVGFNPKDIDDFRMAASQSGNRDWSLTVTPLTFPGAAEAYANSVAPKDSDRWRGALQQAEFARSHSGAIVLQRLVPKYELWDDEDVDPEEIAGLWDRFDRRVGEVRTTTRSKRRMLAARFAIARFFGLTDQK